VDVPCSGLGVLSRRVDLRYRTGEHDVNRLAELQLKLLQSSATYLRPGGILVYSTCTLTPEENYMVVERFLDRENGYRLEPISREDDLLILPRAGQRDGVYAAKLRKL